MKYLLVLSLLVTTTVFSKEVDLKKSSFQWLGTKVSGKHFGEVKLKSANVKMNKGNIQKGTFVIDLNSLTTTDLSGEWRKKFEGHIKSADFFNVEKFPTATLQVSKVDAKNIYGDLTIKGKTNKIKIPYKKKGGEYKGVMKFDRTKFDMVYGSGNFFKNLGDKMINDEVKVDFKVVLK